MSFDASQAALIAQGVYGVVWLIELDFTSGTVYLSTHGDTLSIGGHDYAAGGHIITVGTLKEKAGTSTEKVALSIPTNPAYTSLTLGNVEGYRGRAARLKLILLDSNFQPVGTPKLRLNATMEPVSIQRNPAKEGESSGKIEMRLSREGLDRSRKLDGLRLTDAQQRARFSGDTGMRYLRGLIEKPAKWLSIAFQKR